MNNECEFMPLTLLDFYAPQFLFVLCVIAPPKQDESLSSFFIPTVL